MSDSRSVSNITTKNIKHILRTNRFTCTRRNAHTDVVQLYFTYRFVKKKNRRFRGGRRVVPNAVVEGVFPEGIEDDDGVR